MKNTAFYISLLLNILFVIGFFYIVQRLGGFAYMKAKMRTNNTVGVYDSRKNHLKNLPMPENAIVMLGNSLTQSCEWSELFQNPKVVNRGIAGDMTGGLFLRLNEITQQSPSKIFLMIGINDLSVIPNEKIMENYEKIVQHILTKSPSTQLYLQSILPVNNSIRNSGKSNSDIVFLNGKIKSIADLNGLVFVNLHPRFLDENGSLDAKLTQDGIHLDVEGYLIWKKELQEHVGL